MGAISINSCLDGVFRKATGLARVLQNKEKDIEIGHEYFSNYHFQLCVKAE